jgi:hypothetical protein
VIKAGPGERSPLVMDPIPGLEAMELPGEFGGAQFRAAQRLWDVPIHIIAWLDTEKDSLYE